MTLNDRELAAILCGLRLAQAHAADGWIDDIWADVASDGGAVKPLDEHEIEALCERLKCKTA